MLQKKNRSYTYSMVGIFPNQTAFELHFQALNQNHGVVVITTVRPHSTKPELRFCASSKHTGGVSEIRDGEDL